MDPIELGEMLVRLKGDSSKFDKMLEAAQKSAKETAATIKETTRDINSFQETLTGAGGGIQEKAEWALKRVSKGPTGILEIVTKATQGFKDLDDMMSILGEDSEEIANYEMMEGKAISATAEAYREKLDAIQKYLPFTDEQFEEIYSYWVEVKAIMTTVFTFIRDVLVGIAKLGLAAAKDIKEHWEQIQDALVSVWEGIYARVEPIINWFVERASVFSKAWQDQLSPLTAFFTGFLGVLAVAGTSIYLVFNAAMAIVNWFSETIQQAAQLAAAAWGKTTEALTTATDAVLQASESIVAAGMVSLGAVVGVVALYEAYRVLMVVVRLLKLDVIALFLWNTTIKIATLAWAGVVLVLRGVMAVHAGVTWLLTAAYTALNSTMTAGSIISAGVEVATKAAGAAMGIFITIIQGVVTAISTLNVAMLVLQGVAAAVTVGVIAGAFAGIYAIVKGIIAAVTNLKLVFSDLAVIIGPGKIITDLFNQWLSIAKALFRAMRLDAPLAWQLVVASGRLALAQITAYFTPTWEFIKAGFASLWVMVAASFKAGMYQALGEVVEWIDKKIGQLPFLGLVSPALAAMLKPLQGAGEELQKKGAEALAKAGEKGVDDMRQASLAFTKAFTDAKKSGSVKDAEAAVAELLKKIAALEEPTEAAAKKQEDVGKKGAAAGMAIAQAYDSARAAIYGSLEAASRIQAYLDATFFRPVMAAAGGGGGSGPTPGPAITPKQNRRNIKDLQDLAGWRTQTLEALKQISIAAKQTADNTKTKAPVAGVP